ncbi:otoraplin [Echinops telfairi]|uniref:Otoraplin n=1 Tax=Echinops telfairi TaxID=9371 RepID=A0ABM1VLD6_ECHTE|nr:otoraplin [Echinops telfairi]
MSQKPSEKKNGQRRFLLFLPGLIAICTVHGALMDRLASKKLCTEEKCACMILMAIAQEVTEAQTVDSLNVKKNKNTWQQICIFSKLVKENAAGEFGAGSVGDY